MIDFFSWKHGGSDMISNDSFLGGLVIEVHLRTQEKHEVTQTFFKVAYEYFLQ